MSSGALTMEALQQLYNDCMNQRMDIAKVIPPIICHPLKWPFYHAILIENKDSDKVFRLMNQCIRKYNMGNTHGIEKWQLKPLIEQYKAKLEKI